MLLPRLVTLGVRGLYVNMSDSVANQSIYEKKK